MGCFRVGAPQEAASLQIGKDAAKCAKSAHTNRFYFELWNWALSRILHQRNCWQCYGNVSLTKSHSFWCSHCDLKQTLKRGIEMVCEFVYYLHVALYEKLFISSLNCFLPTSLSLFVYTNRCAHLTPEVILNQITTHMQTPFSSGCLQFSLGQLGTV